MKGGRFRYGDCWNGGRSSDGIDLWLDDRFRRDRRFQIPVVASVKIYVDMSTRTPRG